LVTITGVSVWRGRDVVYDYLYGVGVKYVFGVPATNEVPSGSLQRFQVACADRRAVR
jgi:hypothetical protein